MKKSAVNLKGMDVTDDDPDPLADLLRTVPAQNYPDPETMQELIEYYKKREGKKTIKAIFLPLAANAGFILYILLDKLLAGG